MDFSVYLFIALVITGLIWWFDRQYVLPKRLDRGEKLKESGVPEEELKAVYKEPLLVEYSRAFFPVILIVFILRSFLFEPFRIPSGSMYPNLVVGDFILVNKYIYGIRLPIINKKIIPIRDPRRGEVMVFRYPQDTTKNYIKRIVGLPGDQIEYKDRKIIINGKEVEQGQPRDYLLKEPGEAQETMWLVEEKLGQESHSIILRPDSRFAGLTLGDKVFRVPQGHYFVMGDNRDNSNDSRAWGTVSESYIVGKAVLVWFNGVFPSGPIEWDRIGTIIK